MSRNIEFMRKTAASALFAGVLNWSMPCLAHHSFAMFDPTRTVTVFGTVKDFQWVNPHVVLWVYATPKDGGTPELWTIELTSPGNLTRVGWSRHSVAPGDKVSVEFAPLRNGSHGGGFRKLTFPDTGKVLTSEFRDQERPGLQ
jgi:hypothetical protein